MYLLDCNLKAVEASSFRQRDFGGKVSTKVLVDNAVKSCKEGQDVGDEVLLCC